MPPPIISPPFLIDNDIFDATKKKSKDYYKLLVRNKAQPPYIAQRLQNDFLISTHQLRQVFKLHQSVERECYVKAFQYQILNSILYTNTKLSNIYVSSLKPSRNRCITYSTYVLIPRSFGMISNSFATFSRISKFTLLYKMFCLE